MASNQHVNKVEVNGSTIVDLTSDTATAGDVVQGKAFHLASGAPASGTLSSKPAEQGGTDLSLVTTGEKHDWGSKLGSGLLGASGGVAQLDSAGKVPSSQLPSYVDDVVEYPSMQDFPATGESGKLYVALDTNLVHRWSGTAYSEVSPSLALGETASTAFAGDRGKAAYDHATAKGSAYASGLYKIATNAEGHVTGATAVQKADITALGIPGQDTVYELPTMSAAVKGGAKVGSGLRMDGDELSVSPDMLAKSASGESVVTEDAADAPLLTLDVEGKSVQAGTTGKNLLSNSGKATTTNGIQFTPNADGSVSVKGTATADAWYTPTDNSALSGKTFVIDDGTYTFSANNVASTVRATCAYKKTGSSNNIEISAGTTVSDCDKAWLQIQVYKNKTVDMTVYPQLELGSTATAYEPYTGGKPSPNPDYPQAIRCVRGRNLIDASQMVDPSDIRYTAESLVSVSQDGTMTGVRTREQADNRSYTYENSLHRMTLAPGTYTVSMRVDEPIDSVTNTALSVVPQGAGENAIVHTYNNAVFVNGGMWQASFTLDQETQVGIFFKIYTAVVRIQLERGTEATPYVPYGSIGVRARGKNLLDTIGKLNVSQASLQDDLLTNSDVDTRTGTLLYIQFYNGSSYVSGAVLTGDVIGTRKVTVTAPSEFTRIVLKHSGAKQDIVFVDDNTVSGRVLPGQQYTLSVQVEEKNPSVIGGVKLRNIQLELGSEATSYEPYREDVAYIDLKGNGLHALPDGTRDELHVDATGHVELVKRCGVVSDVSTLSVFADHTSESEPHITLSFPDNLPGAENSANIKSSEYIARFSNSNGSVYTSSLENGVRKAVTFANSAFTNSSDAISLLSGVNVIYALAQSAWHTVDLGYIDMPEAGDGCKVDILAEVPPDIEAGWWTVAGKPVADSISALYSDVNATNDVVEGFVSENINSLQDRLSEVDDGIESLGDKLTEVGNDVVNLDGRVTVLEDGSTGGAGISEFTTTLEGDGGGLTIDGVADTQIFSIDVEGRTWQSVKEGKNLLNWLAPEKSGDGDASTVRDNLDGSGVWLGIGPDNSYSRERITQFDATEDYMSIWGRYSGTYVGVEVKLEPETSYHVSQSWGDDSYLSDNLTLSQYASDGTFIENSGFSGNTVTTAANAVYGILLFNARYQGDGPYQSIMFERGTEATGYEAYCGGVPTPSPDFPEEMTCVTVPNLLPNSVADATTTLNGVTFTRNADETITVKGTATTATRFRPYGWDFSKGTFASMYGKDSTYWLFGCDIGGSATTYCLRVISKDDGAVINTQQEGIAIPFSYNTFFGNNPERSGVYIEFYVASGTKVDITITPRILTMNVPDVPFAPYNCFPLAITGKNLLKHGVTDSEFVGLAISVNPDGSIAVTGECTAQREWYLVGSSYVKNNLATDFGISNNYQMWNKPFALSLGRVKDATWNCYIVFYQDGGYRISTQYLNAGESIIKGTVPFPTDGIAIYFQFYKGNTYDLTLYPQFELGDEATPYVQHHDPIVYPVELINMGGNEFYSLPDGTCDHLHVDMFADVSAVRNVGKVTLDGSEAWATVEGKGYTLSADEAGMADCRLASSARTSAKSNQCRNSGTQWENDRFGIENGILWIGDTDFARFGSLDAFKAHLAETPLIIIYPLATPKIFNRDFRFNQHYGPLPQLTDGDNVKFWGANGGLNTGPFQLTHFTSDGQFIGDLCTDAVSRSDSKVALLTASLEKKESEVSSLQRDVSQLQDSVEALERAVYGI